MDLTKATLQADLADVEKRIVSLQAVHQYISGQLAFLDKKQEEAAPPPAKKVKKK